MLFSLLGSYFTLLEARPPWQLQQCPVQSMPLNYHLDSKETTFYFVHENKLKRPKFYDLDYFIQFFALTTCFSPLLFFFSKLACRCQCFFIKRCLVLRRNKTRPHNAQLIRENQTLNTKLHQLQAYKKGWHMLLTPKALQLRLANRKKRTRHPTHQQQQDVIIRELTFTSEWS